MPWSNQSGGGGPWRPQGQGPWGQGPSGGNGGRQPPDFEDMLRRLQARFGGWFGGGEGFSGKAILFFVLLGVLAWLATGLYTVQPKEVGLNLVFGRYVGTVGPGLNVNWPYPIGQVIKVPVLSINTMEIGVAGTSTVARARPNDEGLMLTGDDNIVDIDFNVQWQVDPARPQEYAFNIEDPPGTIRAVGESVMRQVVGKRNIQAILTTDREPIQQEVKNSMQEILDSYKAGVQIQVVNLLKDLPPPEVMAAFQDVQAASIDQKTVQNQAATYASKVVARGERPGKPDHASRRSLSGENRRRGQGRGLTFRPGLCGIQERARCDARAHVSRDDGARLRRHGQGHSRPGSGAGRSFRIALSAAW